MKTTTSIFKVISVTRRNNSYYGNPAYSLQLLTSSGNILEAKTASNAACGYLYHYGMKGSAYSFTYHFTRSGNCIITNIQDWKKEYFTIQV